MENIIQIFKIIFAVVFVLFLPGHLISYVFFAKGKIDTIERLALSFALSIAIVPLIVFYTNLVGLKISFESVTGQILVIMGLTILILHTKRNRKHDK